MYKKYYLEKKNDGIHIFFQHFCTYFMSIVDRIQSVHVL